MIDLIFMQYSIISIGFKNFFFIFINMIRFKRFSDSSYYFVNMCNLLHFLENTFTLFVAFKFDNFKSK